jgi:penicillin V acylase-like amidase (Ntn superfamily)
MKLLRGRTIVVVFTALLFLAVSTDSVRACTDLVVKKGKFITSARNMDFDVNELTRLMLNPRAVARESIFLSPGDTPAKWVSKYGSVTLNSYGVCANDGLNEKGLSAATLWLGETQWPGKDERPALSSFFWTQYCLDNFATVDEAVKGLEKVRLVSIMFERPKGRGVLPLHLILRDAGGDSAVVEYIEGKPVVHHPMEQPVCTNDPDYTGQLENLKNYKLFGGNMTLPGDTDPTSRFVRAASFLKTLQEPKTGQQAAAWAFDVIKTVSVPLGAVNTSGSKNVMASPTLWTCVRDHKAGLYYFNTVDNPKMRYVDLKKIDFSRLKQTMDMDITLDVSGNVISQLKVSMGLKERIEAMKKKIPGIK